MTLDALAGLLRALSDPCRLRLLWLCAKQPASVSALAAALGETEPTISRHLKALATAGVLRRVRRGQRVEYSLASGLPFDDLIAATLRSEVGADALLARARARLFDQARDASAPGAPRPAPVGGSAVGEQRLGAALALALAAEPSGAAAPAAAGAHLLLSSGRFPVEALRQLAATQATRLLVLADTVAERTAQRRRLADAGLAADVLLRGDLPRALAALPSGDATLQSCFDLRTLGRWVDVETTLRWLQRLPVARSADWLLFDYDTLEAALGLGNRNLPAELRSRLADLGFAARRMQPIEVDGRHRLFVHCVPRAADAARAA